MSSFPEKWRPSLIMIVVAMLLFVLCLPLGGIWIFRFYDNQLVQETESELIAQGAFVTALAKQELAQRGFEADTLKTNIVVQEKGPYRLQLPQLELASSDILPPRAEAKIPQRPASLEFQAMGEAIEPIFLEAQKTTLAGFRIVDPFGTVIAGKSEKGFSLAHIPEVQTALSGYYDSAIRQRISDSPPPPIYSISRGTGIRIFVTMPIEYGGKVAGVVYLSRTPSHFLRELYDQRWKIGAAVVFMLLITLAIAFLFVRTVKGPIDALNARTQRIATGDRSALEPLDHHGTREIASLSQGLLSMSEKLQTRTDYIKTFATHVSHELKSPLTSIKGAAELLRDSNDAMEQDARQKFLGNIIADTDRMSQLLGRLRDLAEAENLTVDGQCKLNDALDRVKKIYPQMELISEANARINIPLPIENAFIVFSNLIDNSCKHGATTVKITSRQSVETLVLQICDNGTGISTANREKITELFFTTRRSEGGTGMGLAIVQSLLNACNGKLVVLPEDTGACFEISFPNL